MSGSSDGAAASFVPEVHFAPCALGSTDGSVAAKLPAECASVDVPLRWDEPGDERVHVFVKRVTGNHVVAQPLVVGPRAHASVWLLASTPGASGVELEPLALELTRRDPTLTVYLADVRGAGRSTRIECAEEEDARSPGGMTITDSEWGPCLEKLGERWGDRLAHFSVSETAHDFAAIADAVVPPGEPLFLYGRGYGSYLATRFADAARRSLAGVVHDGPCLPGSCFFSQEDARYTDAGRALMRACARDEVCHQKLGDDPWTRVGEALDVVEARSCAPLADLGLDRMAMRSLFASYLVDWDKRALIPALTYRILRCGPEDRAALTRFATDRTGPSRVATTDVEASPVLAAHITLSELWDGGATVTALAQIADGSYFSTGKTTELASLHDTWPRYHDVHAQSWPMALVPTLVFTAPLDPETPIGDDARARLDSGRATVLSFGPSTGGAALGAPTASGGSCGADVLTSFFYDADHVDTSCLTSQKPVTFSDERRLAEETFGTDDLWE